jgi:hypothetical protein
MRWHLVHAELPYKCPALNLLIITVLATPRGNTIQIFFFFFFFQCFWAVRGPVMIVALGSPVYWAHREDWQFI